MKTTLVNLFMISSLAALAACSGPPSVEQIEEQLESGLNGDAGVGVKIVTVDNFEKLNGFEKSEKTYIADVKYDVVISKDAKDIIQQNAAQSPLAAFAAAGILATMEAVAGQTFSIQDTVTLIKTEKGWKLTQWHPEAIQVAMRNWLLQRIIATGLSSPGTRVESVKEESSTLPAKNEESPSADAGVQTQQKESQDTLANQEAEMKRVMEENAKLKAENQEAKRRLEEQPASPQQVSPTDVVFSAPVPQNGSQPESAPSISLGKVPNLRETGDVHDAAANPLVAEMITAALANDNPRIIEIRDRLLSQPKPQRGNRKRARALNDEGLSYLNRQEPDKAVASFQLATKMDPGDIEIINNLGYALMKAGQLRESEQALTETLLIAPDRTSAWANLGHVYATMEKKREAVGCFTNAYRFSQNTEKTKNVFTNLSQNHENQNVRQALAEALRAISL